MYTIDEVESLFNHTVLYGNGKLNIARLMTVPELQSALAANGESTAGKRNKLLY